MIFRANAEATDSKAIKSRWVVDQDFAPRRRVVGPFEQQVEHGRTRRLRILVRVRPIARPQAALRIRFYQRLGQHAYIGVMRWAQFGSCKRSTNPRLVKRI